MYIKQYILKPTFLTLFMCVFIFVYLYQQNINNKIPIFFLRNEVKKDFTLRIYI